MGRCGLLLLLALTPGCTRDNPGFINPAQDRGNGPLDGKLLADQGDDGPATPDQSSPTPDLPLVPDLPPDTATTPDLPLVPDLPPDKMLPDKAPPDFPPPKPDKKVLLKNGSPCAKGGQCYTGWCVDKVCCSGPCKGKCMACNLSGAKGLCKFVPSGADPDNDCKKVDAVSTCKLDGMCNGLGGCRFYPSGTVCKAARCHNVVTAHTARKCNGGGSCLPPKAISCFPFNCHSPSAKCYTSCTKGNEKKVCYSYYGCNPVKGKCYSFCKKDFQCNKDGECKKGKCVKD